MYRHHLERLTPFQDLLLRQRVPWWRRYELWLSAAMINVGWLFPMMPWTGVMLMILIVPACAACHSFLTIRTMQRQAVLRDLVMANLPVSDIVRDVTRHVTIRSIPPNFALMPALYLSLHGHLMLVGLMMSLGLTTHFAYSASILALSPRHFLKRAGHLVLILIIVGGILGGPLLVAIGFQGWFGRAYRSHPRLLMSALVSIPVILLLTAVILAIRQASTSAALKRSVAETVDSDLDNTIDV